MNDCRTCKHNTYGPTISAEWVSCSHPKTIAKTPRLEGGDPAWVNFMTADMPVSQMVGLFGCNGACAAYEAAE